MHTEKAKLISCFGNDYCIPRTFSKTISKLNNKHYIFNLYSNRTLQAVILLFPSCPLKKKKGVVQSPVLYCLSVCLSIYLFVCLSVIVKVALKRELCAYALHIVHSILSHMYVNKQMYIDLHLPK
jgi:hypothetical protein